MNPTSSPGGAAKCPSPGDFTRFTGNTEQPKPLRPAPSFHWAPGRLRHCSLGDSPRRPLCFPSRSAGSLLARGGLPRSEILLASGSPGAAPWGLQSLGDASCWDLSSGPLCGEPTLSSMRWTRFSGIGDTHSPAGVVADGRGSGTWNGQELPNGSSCQEPAGHTSCPATDTLPGLSPAAAASGVGLAAQSGPGSRNTGAEPALVLRAERPGRTHRPRAVGFQMPVPTDRATWVVPVHPHSSCSEIEELGPRRVEQHMVACVAVVGLGLQSDLGLPCPCPTVLPLWPVTYRGS